MDGGSWWATVHGITKSQTQLCDFHFHFFIVVSGLTGQAQFSNFGKSKSPIKDSESVQPTVRRTALLTICFKVF